jgi:Zn-finger nucleic acid-binding protein
MRILEVKNWKKVALDRDEWAKLLKKARPTKGCRANDDDDDDDDDNDETAKEAGEEDLTKRQ